MMRVIRPVAITETSLLSSNVPENDYPAYAAGTYKLGERVLYQHHIFESLADSNTAAPTDPTKWLDLGADNRWRMFDKKAGTKYLLGLTTANPEVIDVTIRPGSVVNSFGVFNVKAATVQVTMTDPNDGVVYDKTVTMADTGVPDWYNYYFSPFERRETTVLLDLPAYGTADVRIQIKQPGGTATAGLIVLGPSTDIGDAVYGTGLGLQSYSQTNEDEFGNMTIISRGSRRIVDYDVRIPTERISSVFRLLEKLRDTPSVYIGHESMESTITVGRFENLSTNIANPALCEMSLEVRSIQ
jgi:hypothetical protein